MTCGSQVYGFVKQSGGHILIDSVPGEGTALSLILPRSVNSAVFRGPIFPIHTEPRFDFDRRRAQELEEQRKPQPVQTTWAIGSMEWLAEQNKSK